MTLAEAIFNALGNELSDLAGVWATRVTTTAMPDTQFQAASLGADYAGDPAVVVTLSSGAFVAGVTNGHLFRVLSGASAGAEALILSRDSGIQITLQSTLQLDGVGVGALSSAAWEIVDLADTSLAVESTLNFPAAGRIVVDGQTYSYATTTPTSFDGLTYDDGTGVTLVGVKLAHQPLEEVLDYSRNTSAVDTYRRSWLVDYATGKDLGVIGRNLGVPRPAALSDDDIYRALIKAIAYAPRGTIYALEQALTALLGAGNFDIFEDLTSASPLQNPCTVYVTGTNGVNERFAGKTFAEGGYEAVAATGTDEITLPNDTHIKFAGLQYWPEGGFRDIDGSDTLVVSSADSGVTVTGAASTFSTRIQPGDIFQILDGGPQGLQAVVQSRDTDQQITLGYVQGSGNVSPTASGSIGQDFDGVRWRIVRDKHNVRFYRPSAEQILEGGVVVSPWDYVGGGVEVTTVTPGYSGVSGYNSLLMNTNTNIVAYRKAFRVNPADTVIVEALFDIDPSNHTSGDGPDQLSVAFSDGHRWIAFGCQRDSVQSHVNAGFYNPLTGFLNAGGDFIWSGLANTTYVPGFNTVIIEKRGTQSVRLWRKNDAGGADFNQYNGPLELVAEIPYPSFPTVVTVDGGGGRSYSSPGKDLVFGTLISGMSIQTLWRHIDYKVIPYIDYANQHANISRGNTVATDALTTVDHFADGTDPVGGDDIGRSVRITDVGGANVDGGNAIGEWEITTQADPTSVTCTGATYNRGTFTAVNPSWLVVEDREDAFGWPNVLGHAVQILDGPNAGIYSITGVVNPATGQRYLPPTTSPSPSGTNIRIYSTDPTDATNPVGDGPAVRLVGANFSTGNQQIETLNVALGGVTDTSVQWLTTTLKSAELVPVISSNRRSKPTFNGDIVIAHKTTGAEIMRIVAGETSFGMPIMESLKTTDGVYYDSTKAASYGNVNTIISPAASFYSNILEVNATFDTSDQTEVRWRILPQFPSDDATFQIVDVLHETSPNVWIPRDNKHGAGISYLTGALMAVYRTKVLSSQLHDTIYRNAVNDYALQDYDLYAAYLADQFGVTRSVIDELTAAGVIPDFDSLFIDSSGVHIKED